MKGKHLKRAVSIFLTLAIMASFIPSALAITATSAGWTVGKFLPNDFKIFKHAAPDSMTAEQLTNRVIDLDDTFHFYIDGKGTSVNGLAMMKVDSVTDTTVPKAGAAITDENFYQIDCSSSSSSYYVYIINQDNITEDGAQQYNSDGTQSFKYGLELKYRLGTDLKYIEPGCYRFVFFHRQSQSITYSDVYQLTDKKGKFTSPGKAEYKITYEGDTGEVGMLFSDGKYDLTISSLKDADGSVISLNNANVSKIEFITDDYFGIDNQGTTTDNIVTYGFGRPRTVYDGTAFTDGRTLQKNSIVYQA